MSVPVDRGLSVTFATIALAASLGCGMLPKIKSPDPRVTPQSSLPVVDSYVYVPVKASLAPITQLLEKAVPPGENRDHGNQDWIKIGSFAGQDVGIRYRWERSGISLSASGQQLVASTELRYLGRGGVDSPFGWTTVCCGCDGEWPRRAAVTLTTNVAIKSDWSLDATASASTNDMGSRCKLTALNFDVTDRLMSGLQTAMNGQASKVAQLAKERANVRTHVERAWSALQKPISLAENVSLVVNPSALHLSSINGTGDLVEFSVGLTAHPTVSVGALAPPAPIPLPSATPSPAGNTFHVGLEGELPYEQATTLLGKEMNGKLFPVGDRRVIIEGVRVYGSEAALVVQTEIRGSVTGTVYLMGIPKYDVANRSVYVDKLDYTLETKEVLARAAEWLLHSTLRQNLAAHARWLIGDKLDDLSKKLNDALNRDVDEHVRATGTLALSPAAVVLTETSVKALVVADGRVSLTVK